MGAAWKKPIRILDLPPDAKNPESYIQQMRSHVIEFRTIVFSESPSLRICERRTEQFLQLKRYTQHIADITYGKASERRREFEKDLEAWNEEWRKLLSLARAKRNTYEEGVIGSLGERLLNPIVEEP